MYLRVCCSRFESSVPDIFRCTKKTDMYLLIAVTRGKQNMIYHSFLIIWIPEKRYAESVRSEKKRRIPAVTTGTNTARIRFSRPRKLFRALVDHNTHVRLPSSTISCYAIKYYTSTGEPKTPYQTRHAMRSSVQAINRSQLFPQIRLVND